jgi:hypothetical protein
LNACLIQPCVYLQASNPCVRKYDRSSSMKEAVGVALHPLGLYSSLRQHGSVLSNNHKPLCSLFLWRHGNLLVRCCTCLQ